MESLSVHKAYQTLRKHASGACLSAGVLRPQGVQGQTLLHQKMMRDARHFKGRQGAWKVWAWSSESGTHGSALCSGSIRPTPSQRHSPSSTEISTLKPAPTYVQPARVKFTVPEFVTSPGQSLVIIGSVPALGSWHAEKAARMTWHTGHCWTADIELEPGWHGAVEFKLAMQEGGRYTWEPGSNRLVVIERPKPLLNTTTTTSTATSSSGSPAGSPHKTSATTTPGPASAPAATSPPTTTTPYAGPEVEVVCEWGQTDIAPPDNPPEALQCGALPGLLPNGQHVSDARPQGGGSGGGGPGVMTAQCQVVIPHLPMDSNAVGAIRLGPHRPNCGGAARAAPGVPPQVQVHASSSDPSQRSYHVVLVGNVPVLGCWDPAQGLRLARDENGMWRGRVELPMGFPVHAKLVVMEGGGVRQWEAGPNRVISLPPPPPPPQHTPLRHSQPALRQQGAREGRAGAPGHAGSDGRGTTLSSNGSRAGPSPMLEGGEFMVVAHWGVPTFPHLLFLPAVDHAAASASATAAAHAAPRRGVPCRFTVPHLPAHPGQQLLLVGSCAALGRWDPARGLRLGWGPGHSWQTGGVVLPGEGGVEAKLVMWDGHTFQWEEGRNRQLRPGEALAGAVPEGGWGEVVFVMQWGVVAGHTPALVVPREGGTAAAPHGQGRDQGRTHNVPRNSADDYGTPTTHGGAFLDAPAPSPVELMAAAASVAGDELTPEQVLLKAVSFLTSIALPALNAVGTGGGPVWGVGAGMAASGVGAASRVAALEAEVDAAQGALADAATARQREIDTLRAQLAQSALAAAAEEDEVEALHVTLGAKHAELHTLRTALANAEATATAAVAAATTALSSVGGTIGDGGDGTASGGMQSVGDAVGGVAAAMLQALTDQLAARQLEVDTLRRAAAEATAARTVEVAALRAELSEAVAARHKEVEAGRVAAAGAALARQQDVSKLAEQLGEVQAAREREVAALQARIDAVLAAGQQETGRLSRQLSQACAAVDAVEGRVAQERMAAMARDAVTASEATRLRAALAAREAELEALRAIAADASAADALRLSTAARASRNSVGGEACSEPACGSGASSAIAAGLTAVEAARRETAAHAAEVAVLRAQLEATAREMFALRSAVQGSGGSAQGGMNGGVRGVGTGDAGSFGDGAHGHSHVTAGGVGVSSNGALASHPISFLVRRLTEGRAALPAATSAPSPAPTPPLNNIVTLKNGGNAGGGGGGGGAHNGEHGNGNDSRSMFNDDTV